MNNADWLTALSTWLSIAEQASSKDERHQAALMVGSCLLTMSQQLSTKDILKQSGMTTQQIRAYRDLFVQHSKSREVPA